MTEENTVIDMPEQKDESPQIGIVDLQNALRIIDASAERGTFKGNELTVVGTTRDRIAAFLAAVAPEAGAQVPEPAKAPQTKAPTAKAR
jgi:hypothetical protein